MAQSLEDWTWTIQLWQHLLLEFRTAVLDLHSSIRIVLLEEETSGKMPAIINVNIFLCALLL
jgi:hypothetical protein